MADKKNIVVAGYSRFSLALVGELNGQIKGRLYFVTPDFDQAMEASLHQDVVAIKGEITDITVLDQLDMAECRTFVAGSREDEANVLCALYAKNHGAEKVYARVLETFWQSDAARVYLAFQDGQPLAGGIFLRFGSTAYYWHGANASGAPNLGQGELIQWHVIQWAKEKGCRWYDLVGVEKERLPRIAEFKLGFSRNLVPFRFVGHTPLRIRVLRRIATVVREGWKPNNG